MNKNFIRTGRRLKKTLSYHKLETGFSMLEAVVVVGVLLALAIGGFFSYGAITDNAKMAKVKSAASEVHTGVLAASFDGDATTSPGNVIDNWNGSTDKIKVKILDQAGGGNSVNGDFCIQATNAEDSRFTARAGSCDTAIGGSGPGLDTDGDGIPDSEDPDIDGDGVPNAEDTTPNGDGNVEPPVNGGGSGVAYKLAGWGENYYGELGNGNRDPVLDVAAIDPMMFTKVSVGDTHSCGLSDGKAYCWGSASNGALGFGDFRTPEDPWGNSISAKTSPTAVDASGVLNGKTITDISAGASSSCVIADSAAYCWGSNQYNMVNGLDRSLDPEPSYAFYTPQAVTTDGLLGGKTLKSIVTAGAHVCALDTAGQAYCWGDTQALGNGVDRASLPDNWAPPTAVKMDGKSFVKIAGNNQHFCGIDTTSTVYCWGQNSYGKLGIGSTDNSARSEEPTLVQGLPTGNVTSVTLGEDHTCAIAAGTVYCWGANWSDQLGDGIGVSTGTAVQIGTDGVLKGLVMTSVVTSDYATCATNGKAIFCWGDELAAGNGVGWEGSLPTPVQIPVPSYVNSVESLSLSRNSATFLYA